MNGSSMATGEAQQGVETARRVVGDGENAVAAIRIADSICTHGIGADVKNLRREREGSFAGARRPFCAKTHTARPLILRLI